MNLAEEDPCSDSFIEEASPDQLIYGRNIMKAQLVLPRVGEEYQVDIPRLVTERGAKELNNDAEDMVEGAHSFMIGLPIPIVWVHDNVDKIKIGHSNDAVNRNELVETGQRNECPASYADLKLKVGLLDLASPQYHKSSLDQKYSGNSVYPLPGSIGKSWTDTERSSFLLGLHIFGKKFVQVKRFIENKDMGDILSLYYGNFYRSEEHRRWSECKNNKIKGLTPGERIFTGRRHNKLLSRLHPHLSEESKHSFLKVSKMFTEDKVSLEEYVSTLKGAVGISVLVEAVGIGKGKQDLIEPAKYQLVKSEPAKRVQNIPRPKVPVGNAWSSLTLENIIKFLTGDVRLSKSRSNDLFFEAVWPRLLERGWVSEKPKNCSYTSSKHSVVFLIPGVKKFSRKLVKGDDYFDSVMDVLNKVALEPGLIELEDEKNSVTEENGLCIDTKFDSDAEHSKDQRRSYLQPRLSNQNLNHMKFTVVDTSLDQEEDEISVRMLRSLPAETTTDTSSSTSLSSETDGSCEDPVDGLDASNMLLNDEVNTKIFSPSKSNFEGVLPGYGISISNGEVPVNELPTTTVPMDNDKDQQDASISAYTAKIIKCQFRLREKFAPSSYLSPTKRQRLTASSDEDSSGTTNYLLPDVNENMSSKVGISHDKVSTSSSSKGSPDDIIVEKFQTRALIDLNLPPIPLDFEAYESLTTEVEDEQSFQPNANQQPLSEDSNIANDVASAEILSVVTARRQGTRNRPLTTKALEALACGFLTPKPKRRRRGMGTIPPETSI